MNNVLSYPQYLPPSLELRSYLLFYDKLSTIVPNSDQRGVADRKDLAGITNILGENIVGFFDPTFNYSSWFESNNCQSEFESIIELRSKIPSNISTTDKLTIGGDGYAISQATESIESTLLNIGWNYFAFQKFPPGLIEKLYDAKLAIRVDSIQSELRPVLVDPEIGNFVISRLARQIAVEENIAPVTSIDTQINNFLADDAILEREKRAQTIAVCLNLALPESLDTISVGEYCDIREEFGDTRSKINSLINELHVQLDLDSEKDSLLFKDLIKDHTNDIQKRVDIAYGRINIRKFSNMSMDVIGGAVGGAIGHAFGDVIGGALGAVVGPVVSNYGRGFSTRANAYDIDCIEQIALIRNKIEKVSNREQYSINFPYI